MRPIKIFVEHQHHIKFIQDLASAKCGHTLAKENFIVLSGLYGIGYAQQSFEINSDAGGINIVISDCFHGFSKDNQHMEEIKSRFSISFEHFIFPNNATTGSFESLLFDLIPNKYKDFKRFFSLYEREISNHAYSTGKTYNSPSDAGKLYAYLDAVLSVKDKKMTNPDERDYLNKDYWDIHHESAEPFARFLCSYLR